MSLQTLVLLAAQPTKLAKLNSGHNTSNNNHTGNHHSPKLHLQRIDIEARLRSRTDRRQHHQQREVPKHSVVFIQRLRVLHATVYVRREVLRDAHNQLQDDHDVGHQAKDGVGGDEVVAVVVEFVVLDHDQAGDGGEEGDVVESGVRVGALFLLLGSVGWLEDEDALDEEEHCCGVEELAGDVLAAMVREGT